MKLKNKKTGEIGEIGYVGTSYGSIVVKKVNSLTTSREYDSLAELNDDWEDYEEPKEHFFITEYGGVYSLNEYEGLNNVANVDDYKQIGNYFETKEEAEKAVEKLKAWKRLKDKGFRFEEWKRDKWYCGDLTITATDQITCDDKDLDLLFGGEE